MPELFWFLIFLLWILLIWWYDWWWILMCFKIWAWSISRSFPEVALEIYWLMYFGSGCFYLCFLKNIDWSSNVCAFTDVDLRYDSSIIGVPIAKLDSWRRRLIPWKCDLWEVELPITTKYLLFTLVLYIVTLHHFVASLVFWYIMHYHLFMYFCLFK